MPADLDYREVRGLSAEVQQKLNRHRPETIGQAARISGITPAAISLLLVHLKRGFQPPTEEDGMTPRAALERGLGELALALPAGARERLLAYVALLAKWNRTYNLTAIRDPLEMVSHHLLDSLAVLPHLPMPARRARSPMSARARACPAFRSPSRGREWRVALNDSNQKKAAFLRQAAIELGLAQRRSARRARRGLAAAAAVRRGDLARVRRARAISSPRAAIWSRPAACSPR